MRRRLQGLWRPIHLAPPALRQAVDEMPRVQEAGAPHMVHLQLPEDPFHFGRKKSRIYRAQAPRQRRIRETVSTGRRSTPGRSATVGAAASPTTPDPDTLARGRAATKGRTGVLPP